MVHFPRVYNVDVDRLSMREVSPYEWELNPRYLQPLFQHWRTPDKDVFVNYLNLKCEFFCSRDGHNQESLGDSLIL